MGSLLREYLNVPEKQGDHVFKSNDKEIATTEEKDSSLDNVLHSEGSSVHEPENGVGTSECEESSRKEPQNQVQKGCTEDENSSVRQFKNVVAIVDPPRGGLHPTVRNMFFNFSSHVHAHFKTIFHYSCSNQKSLL